MLPWVLGATDLAADLPHVAAVDDLADAVHNAKETAATLAAQAWGQPKGQAMASAASTLRELRGTEPGPAMSAIGGLSDPMPHSPHTSSSCWAV